MKNVQDVIRYVQRALETGDISDLQVAYEIVTENERRDAEDVNQLTERAIEVDDFEQDFEFAERQKEKELQKIIKKRKTSKLSSVVDVSRPHNQVGGVSLPKPRKRQTRKRGARVNVGALMASRGR
jgi:hypothetical protein|tara:strand:+ start:524 stop:901 length:378 start_codon:yes stop_codon:yes gene_type:complete